MSPSAGEAVNLGQLTAVCMAIVDLSQALEGYAGEADMESEEWRGRTLGLLTSLITVAAIERRIPTSEQLRVRRAAVSAAIGELIVAMGAASIGIERRELPVFQISAVVRARVALRHLATALEQITGDVIASRTSSTGFAC